MGRRYWNPISKVGWRNYKKESLPFWQCFSVEVRLEVNKETNRKALCPLATLLVEKYAITVVSPERFINKFSPANPYTLWRDTSKMFPSQQLIHITCKTSSELLAQMLCLSSYIHSLSTDSWRAKERQTAVLHSALGIKESQVKACQEPSSTLSQLRFSAQRAAAQLGHWQQQLDTDHMAQCSLALSGIILSFSLQRRRHVRIRIKQDSIWRVQEMLWGFCNCSEDYIREYFR